MVIIREMQFNVKNAEILLNPFPYMISKPAPVAPARLMVDTTTFADVQIRWMISLT